MAEPLFHGGRRREAGTMIKLSPSPRGRKLPVKLTEMGQARPSKTDSPFTIDTGVFQIESDVWN